MTSSLAPIAFGLMSAASWGAGDFCGGLATRRSNVYSVMLGSQAAGGLALFTLALIFSDRLPPFDQLAWGGIAGLAGVVGLIALYSALSSGQMSAAAPTSAVISAMIPALVGIMLLGLPNAFKLIGFAFAVIGVWFVSRMDGTAIAIRKLKLPLLAGIGFGVFLIIINRVSEVSILWPLVVARSVAAMTLLIFMVITRRPAFPDREHLPLMILTGVLDAFGNLFFAQAGRVGRLDVAAVLSSLYPASTVALAWLILKERISRLQSVGMVATLIAIVLITV